MVDIKIWAEEDVNLPVSQKQNKIEPIQELWRVGYDLGEKPACEEFNYLLNMITKWIKDFEETGLPALDDKYLIKSNNLNDLTDIAIARTNLSVYSKEESDNRFVRVDGTSRMTGSLYTRGIQFFSNTSNSYLGSTMSLIGDSLQTLLRSTSSQGTIVFGITPLNGSLRTIYTGSLLSNGSITNNFQGQLMEAGVRVYSPNNPQPIPTQGITGVRLASQGYVVLTGGRYNPTLVPSGAVATGWGLEGSRPVDDFLYYRYIQVLNNGVWQTISNV